MDPADVEKLLDESEGETPMEETNPTNASATSISETCLQPVKHLQQCLPPDL